MSSNKQNIDDLFRQILDEQTEPLTDEDRALFKTSILPKRRLLKPKYLKWLPYLAGLSAAASVGYIGTSYINNKQKEKTIVSTPVQETSTKQTQHLQKDSVVTLKAIPQKTIISIVTPVLPVIKHVDYNRRNYEAVLQLLQTNKFLSLQNKDIIPQSAPFFKIQNEDLVNNKPSVLQRDRIADSKLNILLDGGVELGLVTDQMMLGVFSVQLKYNVLPKLRLGIQPAFKMGSYNNMFLPTEQTRYTNLEKILDVKENDIIQGTYDYMYTETYDSISVSYSLDNRIWEAELPFFWEYQLFNKLSLMAGLKFTYGKLPQINRNEEAYSVTYNDTLAGFPLLFQNADPGLLFYQQCDCVPDEMTRYNNPGYNSLRTSFLFGVRYYPTKKLSVGATVFQNASDLSHIPNPQIREAYNLPQIRFSIGYQIK